jgi:2-methylcitrate synthase/citrate synthase II
MMASIAIRDGVEEDAPALARLHLRSRAAAMPWLREVHGEAGIARWIAGTLMGRRRVRVAEAVGVPVGYVGFGQDPRHGPMVMHLYLDPGWRGQGIGTPPAGRGRSRARAAPLSLLLRRNAAAAPLLRGARLPPRRDRRRHRQRGAGAGRSLPPGAPPPDNDKGASRMSDQQPTIYKGLVGVHADVSAVSKVMPETNSLTYRGYAVQDLCEESNFEEVAHLLWHGELPSAAQLAAFQKEERANRALSPALLSVLRAIPKDAHPMDAVRTAVSFMGTEDPETADVSDAAQRRKAMRLLAKLPTAVAATNRLSKGLEPIEPDASLPYCENFFHLVFGKVPQKEVIKAFDVSLILYAEHTFNASTFTARTVTSTGADMHGAITAAIAALKGPLHGGANEAVMHMLTEIGGPDKAADWIRGKFDHKALVMGFGHRVYKNGDSRVPTMTKYAERMAEVVGDRRWMETSRVLADVMLREKRIHPNLDFPAGPAYYLMGFDIPMFTPIFVCSRITGWAAHVFEQAEDNRLIRPLSVYTGPAQRAVAPLAHRG